MQLTLGVKDLKLKYRKKFVEGRFSAARAVFTMFTGKVQEAIRLVGKATFLCQGGHDYATVVPPSQKKSIKPWEMEIVT